MITEEKIERYFYIFLISLFIFITGVQIGIHHGRVLQAAEYGFEYKAFWEVANAD